MKNRNDNMLLRIAQGDAFACATEYTKRKGNEALYEAVERFDSYHQHPSHLKLRPGMYSDDTHMSIFISELLISKGVTATHEEFMEAWFNGFKRDPRDGYSRGFQALLEQCKSVDELRLRLRPDSTKNGAAMRSVPLGVIKNVEDLKAVAMRQAGTTHATYEGCTSSVAVALMSHYALYEDRDFNCMTGWMATHLPIFEKFRVPWVGPVVGKSDASPYDVGINTAWATHTLLQTKHSLREIMNQIIEWGGDTDSVAAVAWGIASARYQDEVLPEFMERDLEAKGNLKYGPEFLKALGKHLMDANV